MTKAETRKKLIELKDLIVKQYYPNGHENEEEFAWFDKEKDTLFIEWWLVASYVEEEEKGKYFLALNFALEINPIVCCNITKILIEEGFNPEILESYYEANDGEMYWGIEAMNVRREDILDIQRDNLDEEVQNDYKRRDSKPN